MQHAHAHAPDQQESVNNKEKGRIHGSISRTQVGKIIGSAVGDGSLDSNLIPERTAEVMAPI